MARWSGPDEAPGIRFVEGDLFSTGNTAIAHGVNMRGVMGAGIAVEFREKFSQMYGTYKALCEHDAVSDMHVMPWKVGTYKGKSQYVMNIFSQVEPGPNAKIELISAGVIRSINFLIDRGINKMSMPWIGCGIGGIEDEILELELRGIMSCYKEDAFTLTVFDKVD
jgi:O-acetyl-ADP-ribose deacetylase (regulator of RNase III)